MYDYRFSDAALTGWVLLSQTWSAAYKAMERRLAGGGLTPEKLDALWACRAYPGPLIPAELSRVLFRENQTISGLVSRMEREGLVKRVPKGKGQPFTEIQITAKGEELCRPGIEVAMALIARVMSALSPEELEQLQELLRKLRQNTLEELEIELMAPPLLDIER